MTKTRKTKFHECGFLSDDVEDVKINITTQYEEEFEILSKLNIILMEMFGELNANNSRKERLAKLLTIRFCQSLQACSILLRHGLNSEFFLIIRNLQECYLALACLLKDESYFCEISSYDETRFKKTGMSSIEKNVYNNKKPDYLNKKFNTQRKYLADEQKKLQDKDKPTAGIFFKKTEQEEESQLAYLYYTFLSNTKCHISVNSLGDYYNIKGDEKSITFRMINSDEICSGVEEIVRVCGFFALKLDVSFLNRKHESHINEISKNFFEYYIQIGKLVHKNKI
ncbi:DUF5677 domain-containing protein [Acetobacter sp. KSO5]|uniref:DUF5677 domain-containing protein n=1 Tax=Acetobacter sp. KSO5 TaxID=3373674 RepID=UPI00376ECEB3